MLTEVTSLERIKEENYFIRVLLNSSPDIIIIINKQRQIVLVNDKFLLFLELDDEKTILGKRPGEAIGCIHARETPGGCNTTKFCLYCGAFHAILNTQKSEKKSSEECRITTDNGNALNLQIWTTPFEVNQENFIIFAVRDISHEKYRHFIERIFFHDILNLAAGLHGIMELMPELNEEEIKEFLKEGVNLSRQLIEEIKFQKALLQAEKGELNISLAEVNVSNILSHLSALYKKHDVARGKIINPPIINGDTIIYTDQTILSRILSNLIKNALEASEPGQTITISYKKNQEGISFSVHNETEIPENIKLQIFNRSFSTKGGEGRGLGTYSVKLLTERYLKGKIFFRSTKEEGTTFTIKL